jgi:hypothetical protein
VTGAAAATPSYHVQPLTTVSDPVSVLDCKLNGDENTPILATDPRDATRVELTYLAGDDRAEVSASSPDAGRTWHRQALPGMTAYAGSGKRVSLAPWLTRPSSRPIRPIDKRAQPVRAGPIIGGSSMAATTGTTSSGMRNGRSDFALAVVIPLEDLRGDLAYYVRSWTHEQTLSRDRYQVVLASPKQASDARSGVGDLLASQDVLIHRPGAGFVELYNAAIDRAQAQWLLLTEAHCFGEPDCLARVARAIEADPALEAMMLDHGHVTASAEEGLSARWFKHIYEQWSRPDEWHRLSLAGFAIRRDTYRHCGGLDSRQGLFSSKVLSARLDARGARVGHAPGARVRHRHVDISGHHDHSAEFACGELEARTTLDPSFAERYFGHSHEWTNRLAYRPEVARPIARALAAAGVRAAASRDADARWIACELARYLPACACGPLPYLARARYEFWWDELAVKRLPLCEARRWRRYLRAQDRVVRLTQLRWIREHVGPPSPPLRAPGRWRIEEIDDGMLVGMQGLEDHGGRLFRWTEPVAVFRMAAPPDPHMLRIDTGGLRASPLDYVSAVYQGNRHVPWESLRDEYGVLSVELAASDRMNAAAGPIAIFSRPLRPADDPRRLGMPVFSVELAPA